MLNSKISNHYKTEMQVPLKCLCKIELEIVAVLNNIFATGSVSSNSGELSGILNQ